MEPNEKREEIQKHLQEIEHDGIKADVPQLKKDMCAQFSDPNEWIREFVVNAYDAKAIECLIYAEHKDGVTTIVVEDDGIGMNKKRLLDFFTIYRSVKDVGAQKAIGRHGIGKLSIAAIPGQCALEIHTSTGEESWSAKAGNLLSDDPIHIVREKDRKQNGTIFRVSFKSTKELGKEVEALYHVLRRYVKYLPMRIIVFSPDAENPSEKGNPNWVNDNWPEFPEQLCMHQQITINELQYNVTLSLGTRLEEIYQNGVFVTNKYYLLSFDREEKWHIPYLSILVDSPDFELPFGRHCLSNEYVLTELSRKIRQSMFPRFFKAIVRYYEEDKIKHFGVSEYAIQELAAALMYYDDNTINPWFNFPLFRLVDQSVISFNELQKQIGTDGIFYNEDAENAGIDYSVFKVPVLKQSQQGLAIKVLTKYFENRCINLSANKLIMEIPPGLKPKLSEAELLFQKSLGLNFTPLKTASLLASASDSFSKTRVRGYNTQNGINNVKLKEEAMEAKSELEDIIWRVNYLVEKDGKTPCISHRFLLQENTVILNLNHIDIKELVYFSGENPKLAGHWAVALCLLDEKNILPHISAEVREDLLLLDAMAKIGAKLNNDFSLTNPEINHASDKFLKRRNDFYSSF